MESVRLARRIRMIREARARRIRAKKVLESIRRRRIAKKILESARRRRAMKKLMESRKALHPRRVRMMESVRPRGLRRVRRSAR